MNLSARRSSRAQPRHETAESTNSQLVRQTACRWTGHLSIEFRAGFPIHQRRAAIGVNHLPRDPASLLGTEVETRKFALTS